MTDIAESAPSFPRGGATSSSRTARWCLVGCYSLAVIWGIRDTYVAEPSALDLLLPVALAFCLALWAMVDAERRGEPIPLSARPWFFLMAGIVVPGYVVWSRRWRGAGWVALHTVLWSLLAAVTTQLGGRILRGAS